MAGKANERFIYTVRNIRDGGYSTRGVDVVQESEPGFCFTCICSFKRKYRPHALAFRKQCLIYVYVIGPEKKSTQSMDVRQHINLRSTFASALGNMKPSDHPEMPGVDAPWYVCLT